MTAAEELHYCKIQGKLGGAGERGGGKEGTEGSPIPIKLYNGK